MQSRNAGFDFQITDCAAGASYPATIAASKLNRQDGLYSCTIVRRWFVDGGNIQTPGMISKKIRIICRSVATSNFITGRKQKKVENNPGNPSQPVMAQDYRQYLRKQQQG